MVAQTHGIIGCMALCVPCRPLSPLLLGVVMLLAGCEAATTEAPLVPPSTVPDPAWVALVTGRWEGISTTTTGVEDYLDFTFWPDGVYARVRVEVNRRRLAEPYAELTGEEVRIEIADLQGNSGQFLGTIAASAGTISGTFTLTFNGTTDQGTFTVTKID
ncbi:MAG: hypothetical protein GEEBNDBF_01364 [bacterium]|nr:hypothetical protein [bacterium]